MDELAIDIFRDEAFRATTTTEMISDMDYVPYEIEAMGLFEPEYLRTTTVTIWNKEGALERVPTSERGSPEPVGTRHGLKVRQFEGVRLAKRDRIESSEVQNMLSPYLPRDTRLVTAQELLADRQSQLLDDINYTKEFHRLGALQGIVYDADGTTVVTNWYNEMEISAPSPVTFTWANFDTDAEAAALRLYIDEHINTPIYRALKRRRRPGTQIHSLVGDTFWGKITSSPAYERLYYGDVQRQVLGQSKLWQTINFAGVVWHHYFGSDDQALTIADDEAIFFPVGAKDTFKVFYMPGENLDEVNAKGKEVYSIVSPDYRPNMNEWIDVYARSYPLFACLCPQALLKGVLA